MIVIITYFALEPERKNNTVEKIHSRIVVPFLPSNTEKPFYLLKQRRKY